MAVVLYVSNNVVWHISKVLIGKGVVQQVVNPGDEWFPLTQPLAGHELGATATIGSISDSELP